MARIFRGRRVSRDTRVIIIPGSRRILSEALDRGFIASAAAYPKTAPTVADAVMAPKSSCGPTDCLKS